MAPLPRSVAAIVILFFAAMHPPLSARAGQEPTAPAEPSRTPSGKKIPAAVEKALESALEKVNEGKAEPARKVSVRILDVVPNPHAGTPAGAASGTEGQRDPAKTLPAGAAIAEVFRGARYVGSLSVHDSPGEDPDDLALSAFLDAEPIADEERSRIEPALQRFFDAALDVTRGSRRFDEFFPENIREYDWTGDRDSRWFWNARVLERLSDADIREFIAAWIDASIVLTWSLFESPEPQRFAGELEEQSRRQAESEIDRWRRMEIYVSGLRGELARLPAAHLQRDREFMKRYLFWTTFKKNWPDEARQSSARRGVQIPSDSLAASGVFFVRIDDYFLLFQQIEGGLKIVNHVPVH